MNPRLIGGEMSLWSDLDTSRGPGPVRGDAFTPLLDAVTGRTLVAGPHDPALLRGNPTLLVRGLVDAEALAGRFAVLCGGPGKLTAEPPWDTVVALDGLERLGSAEDPQLPWGEAFEHLLAVLRPGGTLLLGVENFLGVHRLVAVPPALSDSDWTPAAGYDETRPAGLAAVRARLNAAGLTISRIFAAYPSPVSPAALLDTDLLADATRRGYVEAVLSSACAPANEVLADPARLAIDAVRHGVGPDLASGWIFVAHLDTAPAAGDLPPANAPTGDGTAGRTGFPATIARIPPAEAPAGRTLEDLLLRAAVERDLPALRTLLATWQSGPAGGVPAGQVIVTPQQRHVPMAPAGTPAAALHAFAVTVLSGGFAHPWPAPEGPADLTLILAAMAGVELDPAAIPVDTPRPSMRELIADRDRLTRELAHARARHDFYERTIADRDHALRRARQINALLSTTKPARALLATARWTARRIRR